MAEQTPRINASYLDQFTHRTVRILGKVTQLRGEEATIDAGGQINVHLNRVCFDSDFHIICIFLASSTTCFVLLSRCFPRASSSDPHSLLFCNFCICCKSILMISLGVTPYRQSCCRDYRQGATRLECSRPYQHRLRREHRYANDLQPSRLFELTNCSSQISHLQRQWSTPHTATARSSTQKSNTARLSIHASWNFGTEEMNTMRCLRTFSATLSDGDGRTDVKE